MDERAIQDDWQGKIKALALHHAKIHNYWTLYARGIFTYTEMLERLVLELHRDSEFFKEEAIKAHERSAIPMPLHNDTPG